jgi:hypothetical protein
MKAVPHVAVAILIPSANKVTASAFPSETSSVVSLIPLIRQFA